MVSRISSFYIKEIKLLWTGFLHLSLISCLYLSKKTVKWRHFLWILELRLHPGPTMRWSQHIPAATTNNKLCRIDQHYFKYNVLSVYCKVYNSHIYAINFYFNNRWFINSNRVERSFYSCKKIIKYIPIYKYTNAFTKETILLI